MTLILAHQPSLGEDVALPRLEELLLGGARLQPQFGIERVEFEEVVVRIAWRREGISTRRLELPGYQLYRRGRRGIYHRDAMLPSTPMLGLRTVRNRILAIRSL